MKEFFEAEHPDGEDMAFVEAFERDQHINEQYEEQKIERSYSEEPARRISKAMDDNAKGKEQVGNFAEALGEAAKLEIITRFALHYPEHPLAKVIDSEMYDLTRKSVDIHNKKVDAGKDMTLALFTGTLEKTTRLLKGELKKGVQSLRQQMVDRSIDSLYGKVQEALDPEEFYHLAKSEEKK